VAIDKLNSSLCRIDSACLVLGSEITPPKQQPGKDIVQNGMGQVSFTLLGMDCSMRSGLGCTHSFWEQRDQRRLTS
jgi:hypothetical protein